MWSNAVIPWQATAVALVTIGASWLVSALLSNDRHARVASVLGGLGAGVAALGIAAVLNPVSWITAKEILGVWLVSLGMILVAIIMLSQGKSPSRRIFVACGVVCLLLNVWAIGLLLWIATVSPGGV